MHIRKIRYIPIKHAIIRLNNLLNQRCLEPKCPRSVRMDTMNKMDGMLWRHMGSWPNKGGTFSDQIDTREILFETWVDPKHNKKSDPRDFKKNPIVIKFSSKQLEMSISTDIFSGSPNHYVVGQSVDETLKILQKKNKVFAQDQMNLEQTWFKQLGQKLIDEFIFEKITGQNWGRIKELGDERLLYSKKASALISMDLLQVDLLNIIDETIFGDYYLAEAISLSILKKRYEDGDMMTPSAATQAAKDRLQKIKDKITSTSQGTTSNELYIYNPRYSIPWEVLVDSDLSKAIDSPLNTLFELWPTVKSNFKNYQNLYSSDFSLDQFISHKDNKDAIQIISNDYYRAFQLLLHFVEFTFASAKDTHFYNMKQKSLSNTPRFDEVASIIMKKKVKFDETKKLRAFLGQYSRFKDQMESYSNSFDSKDFLSQMMNDDFKANTGRYKGFTFAQWLHQPAKNTAGNFIRVLIVKTITITAEGGKKAKTETFFDDEDIGTLTDDRFLYEIYTVSGDESSSTNLDLLSQIHSTMYSNTWKIIKNYFNSDISGQVSSIKAIFNSKDLSKADFARRWAQFYGICNEVIKSKPEIKTSRFDIINGKFPSYHSKRVTIADFINNIYHGLFTEDDDILTTNSYSLRRLFPDRSYLEANDFNALSVDQMSKMDQMLVFFAQLFTFTKAESVSESNIGELNGFNAFLTSISNKYTTDYIKNSGALFSGEWSPFFYQISNVNTDFALLKRSIISSTFERSFLWPVVGNLDNTIIKGYMSGFEGDFFKYLERLMILAKFPGGSALISTFHSSKNMQSLMHNSKQGFEKTGQVDFGLVLASFFPLSFEFMGAGEKMWSPSRKVYFDYGVHTDEKLEKQILAYLSTISVSYDSSVYNWYNTKAEFVGKINPSITIQQAQNLISTIALAYHPTIRTLIEDVCPGIYYVAPSIPNDPLRVALYLLRWNGEIPVIDWNTGNLMQITQPFYQVCGFSSPHTAQIMQQRFGLLINEDFSLNSFTTTELGTWWIRRDILISCFRAGTCSDPEIQPVFDLYTTSK